jgi:hypothetical protein
MQAQADAAQIARTSTPRKVVASPAPDPSEAAWKYLLSGLTVAVAECNITAGQPLWKVVAARRGSRLTVCYAARASRCLELSFRRTTATVRCVYGCDSGGVALELQAAGDFILVEGRRVGVPETVTMLLDTLVAGLD